MAHIPRRIGEQEVLEMLNCRARVVDVVVVVLLVPVLALSMMIDLNGDAPDHIEVLGR